MKSLFGSELHRGIHQRQLLHGLDGLDGIPGEVFPAQSRRETGALHLVLHVGLHAAEHHPDTPAAQIRQQGRRNGALLLFSPHTTCGLTINEGADPDVRRDMVRFFSAMVPQDADFDHAEGNSDAHIKTTLHGPSLMLIVEDGQLQLGRWQSIYLCEGDGPRQRTLWAQWLPGEDSTRP